MLKVPTESSSIALGLFFRPPNDTNFSDEFEKTLGKVWLKHKNIVLLGDFNIKYNEETAQHHEILMQK